MFRIAWLSTGRDEAAGYLLREVWQAIRAGRIQAEIPFVFCNRDPGESRTTDEFLGLVKGFGIPVRTRSWNAFKTRYTHRASTPPHRETLRVAYDREIMPLLEQGSADVYALVGYMLILGPELCQQFPCINLHPAPPGGPAGAWEDVIWHLIETEATESGIIIHRVTPELDRGPILTYCRFPIRGEGFDPLWQELARSGRPPREKPPRLFHKIREAGVRREAPLLVETLRTLADGQIRIQGEEVHRQGQKLEGGLSLTREVEALLGASEAREGREGKDG
jgi:phosphoribosylglycinamide formyltransferase-1